MIPTDEEWSQKFADQCVPCTFEHPWTMEVFRTNEKFSEKGHCYTDGVKYKFKCSTCTRSWTSMKGCVRIKLSLDTEQQEGIVQLQPTGQMCRRCKKTFEEPSWYAEEMDKVAANIGLTIHFWFYEGEDPELNVGMRSGKPRSAHNSRLCQACTLGVCRRMRIQKNHGK